MRENEVRVSRRSMVTGFGAVGAAALLTTAGKAEAQTPRSRPGPASPSSGPHPHAVPAGVNPIASAPQSGCSYVFRTMWDFTPENFISGRTWTSAGGTYAPNGGGDTLWTMVDLPAGAVLADVEWYLSATQDTALMGRVWVAGVPTLMKVVADGIIPAGTHGAVRAARIVVPAGTNGPFPHGTQLALGVFTPGDASVAINGVRVGFRRGGLEQVLLPVPVRVYDSRKTAPIGAGKTRINSLASVLPIGATGAIISLTALRTHKAGGMTVWAASNPHPGVAHLHWNHTSETITITTQVGVSASRAIKVFSTGRTDYAIDVLGYTV